jgi:ADP-ribosyl-[dinitrogen reductase] hydrolase
MAEVILVTRSNESGARDVLLGVLYGDCLGAPHEFDRGPITGTIKIGASVFGHPAGRGTDDTETTFAVAQGLIDAAEAGQPATVAIADRLLAWYEGHPPDVGGTTANGLNAYRRTGDPRTGSTTPQSVANGSLMRSAPFALIGRDGADLAVESSRTTHAHPEVLACVRAYVRTLQRLLCGEDVAVQDVRTFADFDLELHPSSSLEAIPCAGIGHAVFALDLAAWAATRAESFAGGIEAIVRLGGDTDTNGAICGAVLAARFGLPPELTRDLDVHRLEQLEKIAARLSAVDAAQLIL